MHKHCWLLIWLHVSKELHRRKIGRDKRKQREKKHERNEKRERKMKYAFIKLAEASVCLYLESYRGVTPVKCCPDELILMFHYRKYISSL
jgi:hypothetical protein